MISWVLASLGIAAVGVLILIVSRGTLIFPARGSTICWHCLEEYAAAATNCPVCDAVKDKPYRCRCGRLHAAAQNPCDLEMKR